MYRNELKGRPSPRSPQGNYQDGLFQRRFLHNFEGKMAYNMDGVPGRRYSLDYEPDEVPINPNFVYGTFLRNRQIVMPMNDSAESLLYEPHFKSRDRIEKSTIFGDEFISATNPEPEGINTEKVAENLTAVGRFLEMVQKWPLPRLSFTTACICFLLAIFISPRSCAQSVLFPAFRLSFGTLYPAYASYKAVRTKNVKEYVKWMMYWIVYAFFTCIETFTDIFLSWFPFYYEVKVVIVLWLLSPATKGSSTLYRKFVHPMLTRREQEIDEYLNQAKERGYSAVLQLGSKGVNYATNVIMQTALKGGGNLVQTIRRSYSLSDLSEPDMHRTQDEIDEVATIRPQQRLLRPRLQTAVGRSASGTRHSTGMYFTEVDATAKCPGDFNYNVRSSDDISSGYSSAEPVSSGLSRTCSMTNASKPRLRGKRTEKHDKYIQPDFMDEEEEEYNSNIYTPIPTLNKWSDIVLMENTITHYNTQPSYNNNNKIVDSNGVSVRSADETIEIPVFDLNCSVIKDELSVKDEQIINPGTLEEKQIYKEKEEEKDTIRVTNEESDDDDVFLDTISTEDVGSELPFGNLMVESQLKSETLVPRELKETLKEINSIFQATIEAPSPLLDNREEKEGNTFKRPVLHSKGKAPLPPPPPLVRKLEQAGGSDNESISSFSSIRSVTPPSQPAPRKSLFRSIFGKNNTKGEYNTGTRLIQNQETLGKETEI